MGIRNNDLFSQIKTLADAFIDVMDNNFVESYGATSERVEALAYGDPNLVAKILELRPDLKEESLSKCLTIIKQLLKTLMESDVCKTAPHPSNEEGFKRELAWFLTRILEARADQSRHFTEEGLERQYNDTLFPNLYKIFEDYLYNPSPKEYLICPVRNLTSSRPIDLESWQIRGMSENEVSSLVEAHNKHGIRLEAYPDCIICLNYIGEWQDAVRKILAALRLLKREKIFLKHAYHASYFPFYTWLIMNAPEGTRVAESIPNASTSVTPEEESELRSIWTVLSGISDTSYITTALRRFSFAYERERMEDAWVDYFVSLESLFLKDSGENFELIHRLSNRISKVLGGSTFLDRKKMKKKIENWYGIRSKIVHGVILKSEELTQIDELNQEVRASLKWFINNGNRGDHDTILDMLDLMQ
jgi:hypothetical protein